MKQAVPPSPTLLIPFREVRHSQPDDCLHYEPIAVRGELHGWTIPAHRHEGLHQFQLIVRGSASASIDGRPVAIQAPAATMLAPGSVHGFRYEPGTVGHQITIPTGTLRSALNGAGQLEAWLGQSFVLGPDDIGDASVCAARFDALADEFRQQEPGRAQALLAQAVVITLWFLRRRGALPAEARHQALRDTLVQRLRGLIERHYREHQPVSFYARTLGVTADHLSRSCRAVSGSSALDLVHARLMLEARRLLVYTPMSVAEVAQTLGYDDPAYFSKSFARSVGSSPSAYREAVHNGVQMKEAQPPQEPVG